MDSGVEAGWTMITLPNKYNGEPEAVAHSEVLKRLLKLQFKQAERNGRFEEFVRKITRIKE